jgi:aldehyde dehydrogenase (NAD+)
MTNSTGSDHQHLYIGGEWTPAGGASREVTDPVSAKPVATVRDANAADVARAVQAARAAFEGWSTTSPAERASALQALQVALEDRVERLVEAVRTEVGAPEKLARAVQVGLPMRVLATTIQALLELPAQETIGNSTIVREAVGVVAAITPWNYPLHQAMAKIAAAVAAGCTVVHKPAELTPLSALVLAEAVAESGLPAGVYNLVLGDGEIGAALADDPDVDMVSFTGSTEVGRHIAANAAATVKRVALELGGKSASVVLDDVDADLLKTAVKVSLANCFLNSGQTCTAWTRLLVPQDRLAETEAAVLSFIGRYKAGESLGPMISADQQERVTSYMRGALTDGARLVVGGPDSDDRPAEGFFVAPTVFSDVTPTMTIAQEEVFGPVLVIMTYTDEDDAVRIANGTMYGLAGGVWSASADRAFAHARRLRTGQVDINGGAFNPAAPFGGYKQSGLGRELGPYGLHEFFETKSIQQ